jgi:ligand-binding sensor protein
LAGGLGASDEDKPFLRRGHGAQFDFVVPHIDLTVFSI